MRKATLVCLLWGFPAFAPLMPPLPTVTDDRESIRRYVGALSMRMTIQSNMFAGIVERESRSSHRTNRDPKRGVITGYDGDTGATQTLKDHEKRLRKVFGPGFSLTNLADNLKGGAQIYQDCYLYYQRRGWNHRQATLRAIQAFNCGITGRTWESRIYRRRKYMYYVLKYAENHTIPYKYR